MDFWSPTCASDVLSRLTEPGGISYSVISNCSLSLWILKALSSDAAPDAVLMHLIFYTVFLQSHRKKATSEHHCEEGQGVGEVQI